MQRSSCRKLDVTVERKIEQLKRGRDRGAVTAQIELNQLIINHPCTILPTRTPATHVLPAAVQIGKIDPVHSVSSPSVEGRPLIDAAVVTRLLLGMAILATLTLSICIGGRWLGGRIALAGNSDSPKPFLIAIGQDKMLLPANSIRFPTQRKAGSADRINLGLTWPEMAGYSQENRLRFDDMRQSTGLIFVQLSQAIMSRDMSGRLEPIYKHVTEGPSKLFVAGLTLHTLKKEAGYQDEVLLTASRPGQPDYVVRCTLPESLEKSTSADCQRDVAIGKGMSVLYRFSSLHLNDWRKIDEAVTTYVSKRLIP